MSNVILTLGGVPFRNFEVPEKIRFGGAQRVAVHELIGGGRVVDTLGETGGEVLFSGIFSGNDARARVQILDAARALGAAIPLVWDTFFYTVVIAEFVVEYTKQWWIPFGVRCVVVIDPVATLAALATPVANLISGDIASVTALAPLSGISISGQVTPSVAGLGALQSQISTGISNAGLALASGVSVLSGAADPITGVNSLNQIVNNSGKLAALSSMRGYANRAAANVASELI